MINYSSSSDQKKENEQKTSKDNEKTNSNIKEENKVNKYDEIHEIACQNKEETYIDPDSGYMVFTKYAHLKRGKCCGSGCRHCPYNHINVKKLIDF